MKFGFYVPHRGALASPDAISTIAEHGEALGYGYALVADHIVVPRRIRSDYPYAKSGAFAEAKTTDGDEIVVPTGSEHGASLEQLSVMAYLAAVTTKLRLLSSVLVVPHRPATVAAKSLATIDVLSKGRVTVGCGAGWLREEFVAIGAPDFDARGEVTNEYLAAFKELWTADRPTFSGRYVQFSDISFLPKPVQRPHPPVWVGGESPAAMRRAARLGDGWCPIGANPRYPLDTPERVRESIKMLHDLAEARNRDPATIELSYLATWYGSDAMPASNGKQHLLSGTMEDVVADVEALHELGIANIFISVEAGTLAATLERMTEFSSGVMAQF